MKRTDIRQMIRPRGKLVLVAVVLVFGLLAGGIGSSADGALIGHWEIEAGSGASVDDVSTTDNDGSFVNSPTWVVSGFAPVPSGTTAALEFDGETASEGNEDYVSVPANSVYDFGASLDFSVAAWFKTSAAAGQNIVGQGDAGGDAGGEHWELTIRDDGTFVAFIDDGSNTQLIGGGGPSFNDGKWHHVAVTFDRDGDAIRYIDGVALPTTDDISHVGDISNDEILAIGQRGNVSGKPFDSPFQGQIDEVRLYDHVLSPEEVRALTPEPGFAALSLSALLLLLARREGNHGARHWD